MQKIGVRTQAKKNKFSPLEQIGSQKESNLSNVPCLIYITENIRDPLRRKEKTTTSLPNKYNLYLLKEDYKNSVGPNTQRDGGMKSVVKFETSSWDVIYMNNFSLLVSYLRLSENVVGALVKRSMIQLAFKYRQGRKKTFGHSLAAIGTHRQSMETIV